MRTNLARAVDRALFFVYLQAAPSMHRGTIRYGDIPVFVCSADPSPEGFLLRRLRRALRLNLEEAAAALGTNIVMVSEIERGVLVMSEKNFVRGCRLLVDAAERRGEHSMGSQGVAVREGAK